MERIEDERLLFFIEHAAQIRQWAALESEVRDLVDRFLTDMVKRWLKRDPVIQGALHASAGGEQWPRYDLYRPVWLHDGKPMVSVSLEWHSRRVGLDPDVMPTVGARVRSNTKGGPERRQDLQAALAAHRKTTGGDSNKYWAAFRRVTPAPDDPGNLDAFETRLCDALEEEWHATIAPIDLLLAHGPET